MALPTMAPSDRAAMRAACSGVEMPKPTAQGMSELAAHQLHHGADVRGDAAAHTRHAQAGHHVHKAAGLPGDHGDAMLRRGGNEGDEVKPVLAAQGRELLLLLKGHVGENQPVHADVPAGGEEFLRPVGEHHVGVGHEHHGHAHIPAQIPHQVKAAVGGGSGLQGTGVGSLDHRALRRGVGEGNAQLDHIRPGLRHGADSGSGGFKVRVAAGDERNEGLAPGKGVSNTAHSESSSPL